MYLFVCLPILVVLFVYLLMALNGKGLVQTVNIIAQENNSETEKAVKKKKAREKADLIGLLLYGSIYLLVGYAILIPLTNLLNMDPYF